LTILQSAKLSIRVNGSLVGYFCYRRGVRQSDPLSPLLFCIAKEVLNRGIANLILTKHILPMVSPKGFCFPSHVLYADDIFVFCRANKRSLSSLMKFLHSYHLASGQWINTSKSHFFTADTSPSFLSKIKDVLGCNRGNIPFNYLRVPIFVGSRKARFLQPLVDKVRSKLASWKGKSLSMTGRIELVNSMIYGSLAYNF